MLPQQDRFSGHGLVHEVNTVIGVGGFRLNLGEKQVFDLRDPVCKLYSQLLENKCLI
jgi:hypothetical protein